MKYLLIDGNNLAIRNAFANDYMTNKYGELSGAHYGFFNSLLGLRVRFRGYQFLVAWDSSSQRRVNESKEAVSGGLIKEGYKANRKKDVYPPAYQAWKDTAHHLKHAVGLTGIPQIWLDGYEADDVIATYCQILKKDHEVVSVTSDHDYYQLLEDNVSVWDGVKREYVTEETFTKLYDISPKQHVDVGALMGDSSDNIFGIPGWGEKTALKAIQKHGSWENVIKSIEDKYSKYREDYPDFSDEGNKKFIDLHPDDCRNEDRKDWWEVNYAQKETKTGRPYYPEIYWGQPYSGLMEGVAEKKIKIPKTELMALMFKDRVELAYSLKSMDLDIENLPKICQGEEKDKAKLLEYFNYYDIVALVDRIDILFEEEFANA